MIGYFQENCNVSAFALLSQKFILEIKIENTGAYIAQHDLLDILML